ncbi:sodium:alanine symporter [Thalassobacillus devorans]|uniref:Sodium:alanine symporter n=1 Tax=Thalassobacillus devorans TaxID=279813 RepID=A0ABQ1PDJ5_9BACI|nr:sodium:alanine symporter family protein [Thalassobacillus devorans]NIK29233.1 AGCS family alanine or glycine:cation symporter [Thalassobacillus devorans]GGC95120.1 sodium:alanine symporter [Thalassobacillus devorans]
MENLMSLIETGVADISNFLWTYVLAIILIIGGIFLTVQLKFFQFRFFGHVLQRTVGQIFKKNKHEGTITPFQAFTSALASTAGATNIVGVPLAIAMGGPGALFWMWMVALIGMATRYSEILLGLKYRELNKEGVWVGGPQYYIKKGLGWNKIAALFAFFLMIEIIPSVMVQSNSITTQVEGAFGWPAWITGIAITILIGIIVFGGIKRIGKVTDKLVPFMVISYLLICFIVIFANIETIPSVFGLIFAHAFTPISAAGGFAGAGIAQALRWGIARGLYSNEAGLGTGPVAHAAAQTDHPSKQALWGIFSVFVDTIVICTVTGLTVLTSGAWKEIGSDNSANMVNVAFGDVFGEQFGGAFVAIFLLFFVFTTVSVVIFFGEKQAEYLFGLKFSKGMRIVYVISIYLGAIGGLQFVWQFLDLLLAAVVVFNIIPVLFMYRDIKAITEDYIERIYRGKGGNPKVKLFTDEARGSK